MSIPEENERERSAGIPRGICLPGYKSCIPRQQRFKMQDAEKDEAAFYLKKRSGYGSEKVSGAVRGNAFHRTMELLDFTYQFTESGLFTGCPNNYEEYRRGLDKNRLQNRLEEFLQRETISFTPDQPKQSVCRRS